MTKCQILPVEPRQLDWVDWLSVIGSIISIATVLWFLGALVIRLRRASVRHAVQEFDVLARRPWHIAMFAVVLASSTYLIAVPPSEFPASLLIVVPVASALLLLISFFIAQNSRLLRNMILNEIRKAVRESSKRPNQPCSAIRFDIDLIVAINDYSFAVGQHVFELVQSTLRAQVAKLKRGGVEVTSITVPEGDETILLLPGMSARESADVADEVRRHVKAGLPRIPDYEEACEYVIRRRNPPLTDEEKQGIGTVSAGVAAFGRGDEVLLADISAAVKEAKYHGRNKTVIYNRDGNFTVRR